MDERKLADILVRHAVGSQGFGNDIADKIVRLLNTADADLVEKIAGRYASIQSAGYDRGPATTKRLTDMLDAIRAINSQVYQRVADDLEPRLIDAAGHEIDFTTRAAKSAGASVDTSTTVQSAAFLKTLVNNSPIDGRLLGSWIDGMSDCRMASSTRRSAMVSCSGA